MPSAPEANELPEIVIGLLERWRAAIRADEETNDPHGCLLASQVVRPNRGASTLDSGDGFFHPSAHPGVGLSKIVGIRRSWNNVQVRHVVLDLVAGVAGCQVHQLRSLLRIEGPGPARVVLDDLELGGVGVARLLPQGPGSNVWVTCAPLAPTRTLG